MKIDDKLELITGNWSRNRIVMPPMDTLMAEDGFANSFHIQHYAARGYGGVGTIIVESTAVSSEGRIRSKDLGFWKDEHIAGMKLVVDEVKKSGAVIGVQLNHAGSKSEIEELRYGATNYYKYLDQSELKIVTNEDLIRIEQEFVDAAKRAKVAGFDFVELHAAHGYLMSELLSNNTINNYNGDLPMIERGELIINVAKRIIKEVGLPVGMRISAHEGDERGLVPSDFKEFLQGIEVHLSYIHASSGAVYERDNFDYSNGPLIGLPHALEIRSFVDIPVITVRNYVTKEDVQTALDAGIDAVAIGRNIIFKPSLVVTELIEPEDIDNDLYHWNQNIWYNHKKFAQLQKNINKK